MGKTKKEKTDKLDRLVDSMIDDIQEMPDEEVLELAIENYGGIKQLITNFNSAVEKAEKIAKVRRFEAPKEKLGTSHSPTNSAKIINLPLDQKKSILEMIRRNKLITTLAARNATDYEADIDTMLEDLVDLGVIDENGNQL